MFILQVHKLTIDLGYFDHNMSNKSDLQMTKSHKFDNPIRTANLGPKFMPVKSKPNLPNPFIIDIKQNFIYFFFFGEWAQGLVLIFSNAMKIY